MRDRIGTLGPIAAVAAVAAVAGVFGLCCGLPVLLSLGVVGAIAGWSLQSAALIGLGVALLAVGLTEWAKHRPSPDLTCDLRSPSAYQDTTSHGTSDDSPKESHK